MKRLPGYPEVLDHFERLSGRPPDARWRALLRPASTGGVTRELFGPYLRMEHQQMDVEGLELLPELNSAETRLVQLALHLCQGCGEVSLVALAERLDAQHWQAVLEAWQIYRSGKDLRNRLPKLAHPSFPGTGLG